MISVGALSPGNQWDQNILDRLFANQLYHTGLEFRRVSGYPSINVDGCVLIIPGRYWHERCNEISEAISRYEWVLAIRAGDEDDQLDPYKIYHHNIRWWVQTPHAGRDYDGARRFGCGYPPHFNQLHRQDRDTDVFLAGQNTNQRRRQCFAAVEKVKATKVIEPTPGFTKGMVPDEYALWMCAAKVAPCPSGPKTPDTFRLYEALEAHTVPIADDVTPAYPSAGSGRSVFPDAPFPIFTSYANLPGYIHDQLAAWPANANRITAWWMHQKRQYTLWLLEDLEALGAL